MQFEWDNRKNHSNLLKHGLAFSEAEGFSWHEAVVFERSHVKDDEQRFVAVGMLKDKLHTIVFTSRGLKTRIISLRRANKQEKEIYEEEA